MTFKSKTEAYSATILLLTRIREQVALAASDHQIKNLAAINTCLDNCKRAMENHEQNMRISIDFLSSLLENSTLPVAHQNLIRSLQEKITASDYNQTTQQKYENPLARRAESELAITLLQNPTHAMMTAVKRVSDELLTLIDDFGDSFNQFLPLFFEGIDVIGFGAFKGIPTKEEIQKILQANDPAQLTEILCIHFKFAHLSRSVQIKHAPVREPVGELKAVIQKIWAGTPQEFFSKGIAMAWPEGDIYRSYICNELMYKSPLYTAIDGKRGRQGVFDKTRTKKMGLMLRTQEEFEADFPQHSSSWAADCKSQPADYYSPYVLDLVENDAVYVAGPSGMTSMLLGQMEILANFENEDLKKNYLTAVMSYIVGGGFHSIHEVIGPAENALKLVPGYNVQIPEHGKLAPPPNYHQFFSQQEQIDPEFRERHEQAWARYLRYLSTHYAPKYLRDVDFTVPPVPVTEQPSLHTPTVENLTQASATEKPSQEAPTVENATPSPTKPENFKIPSASATEHSSQKKGTVENTTPPLSKTDKKQSIPNTLKADILTEINSYIKDGLLSRDNSEDKNQLSFISRFFRNKQLTTQKLTIAREFREKLGTTDSLEDLKTLVTKVKTDNKNAEAAAGKTYGLFTKSGLERSMNDIDAMITAAATKGLGR